MRERSIPAMTDEDNELPGGNIDPDLKSVLEKVNSRVIKYKGRVVSGVLPRFLTDYLPIMPSSVLSIHDSARKSGIIEPKNGKSIRGYYYDGEDVLVFTAVCWFINEQFRDNGSFDKPWVDTVEETKDKLGGDNFLSRRLHLPNDPNARFSTGWTSYEIFSTGNRKKGSKYGDRDEDGGDRQQPEVYTPREQMEDTKRWDVDRIRRLLDVIPDTLDSIDSVSAMKVIPPHIIELVMEIHDFSHGQNPYLRRVNEGPVSTPLFKTALREYLTLSEIFKQDGEYLDMLGLRTAVRREYSAGVTTITVS